uniref:Nucleolar and spindle associated protein 1 n=1 Tax=Oreochromis niloticus TaxID=8128 RepID=I3KU84_ORENI
MDLDSMKYAELRSLAKELGLKANMKVRELYFFKISFYCLSSLHSGGLKPFMIIFLFKGDTEVDASTAPCNARGGKKRKVSSTIDKEKNEPPKKIQTPNREEQQLQPAIKDEAPVTAETDFKKLHEAHFNKMESIDSYVQRKTKQMETYRNSVKELKSLSDKTELLQVDGKAQRANPTRASMFSPAPVNKTPGGGNRRHTLLSATKKPLAKEVVSFRPSVLSTRRINVRFSEATHDNEYKRSLVKTPARMSPCVASSTPQKQTANGLKPSSVKTASFSATKTPGPFVFTGNTSTSTTPGTNKKPSFDLKASLSRPLTYKPHKGKLKPFGDVKENMAMNQSISNPHQEAYKQHKVQSREGRRAKQVQDRKQKKESILGARRGLVMA